MRILIADDDRLNRRILTHALEANQFDVVEASDGDAAWKHLQGDPPSVAILDWMMPGPDGLELCRRIRRDPALAAMYVIVLSSRDARPDLVAGLEAGADDYLIKPFDPGELRARINVGARVLGLQRTLAEQVAELQAALANVRQLQGLLPICSYCKRIRSDDDYWEQIESYVSHHSGAQFSHGICPECLPRALAEAERATPRAKRRARP